MGNQVTSAPEPFNSTCLLYGSRSLLPREVWHCSGGLGVLFYFWAYNKMPGVLHILSIPAGFSLLFHNSLCDWFLKEPTGRGTNFMGWACSECPFTVSKSDPYVCNLFQCHIY